MLRVAKYDGPAYGIFSPTLNPFGTGFYHGWTTGENVTGEQVVTAYPYLAGARLTDYLAGRAAGVHRDNTALAKRAVFN